MPRGRPPKPSALKLAEGDRGKGRRGKPKKDPAPSGLPPCPSILCADGKREWKRVSKLLLEMGLLAQTDMAALSAYCNAYAEWRLALKDLRGKPRVVLNNNGNEVVSPRFQVMQQAQKLMHTALIEFGLSPVARARIIGTAGKPEESDPLESGISAGASRGPLKYTGAA